MHEFLGEIRLCFPRAETARNKVQRKRMNKEEHNKSFLLMPLSCLLVQEGQRLFTASNIGGAQRLADIGDAEISSG